MDKTKATEIETINPATGRIITRYPVDDEAQIERILAASKTGFRDWRNLPLTRRAELLMTLSATLEDRKEALAALITAEMGKTLREARAEIQKSADQAKWYAEHGPALLADEPAPVGTDEVYVSYLPIGVVLAIMPWNLPIWQVTRAAIPIMLGGNGFVLKHAPNVMGCAYALKDVFDASGFPPGAFGVLNVGVEEVATIIQGPHIAAVTLTGSVRAGSAVASLAGKVVKKSLLELGGSDPFIVLADADLEKAVEAGIKARFSNAGQVCLAAKRFILEGSIAEEFTARFVQAASKLVVGDPTDDRTDLGPIARADLREGLHKQVQATKANGALLLVGGNKKDGAGFFYEPTVFGAVKPGMTAFEEETFGPVAAITVAKDAEDAIRLANASSFGLGGNLWTRDIAKARIIARRLETGAVFINGYTASNPRTPVGGVKQSGYGRELSHFGLHEFINAQTVWIRSAT
jgi:succinate-semialdehyde dehydrogenase